MRAYPLLPGIKELLEYAQTQIDNIYDPIDASYKAEYSSHYQQTTRRETI